MNIVIYLFFVNFFIKNKAGKFNLFLNFFMVAWIISSECVKMFGRIFVYNIVFEKEFPMKYSRSALGLLNAQYRSVLRKCFLINVGVFALGMTAAQADNFKLDAEKLSTSSNIKWVEISADKYDESNKNMIKVDLSKNESQYFQYTYTSDPDRETISERQT